MYGSYTKHTDADKYLHEIEKCCGCCVCPWNRVRSTTKVKAHKQGNGSREGHPPVITNQPRHSGNGKGGVTTGGGGGYIQRVTNDEREDEIDENLE